MGWMGCGWVVEDGFWMICEQTSLEGLGFFWGWGFGSNKLEGFSSVVF